VNRMYIIPLGLSAALFIAIFLSPFASTFPDGLERVAQEKGFLEKEAVNPAFVFAVADYSWPGIKNKKSATSAAGAIGTLIVFGAAYACGALLRKKEHR